MTPAELKEKVDRLVLMVDEFPIADRMTVRDTVRQAMRMYTYNNKVALAAFTLAQAKILLINETQKEGDTHDENNQA